MASIARQMLGFALLAVALLGSGCAPMSNGMRPVMTVDGQRMDFNDPVERARGLVATGQYGLAIDTLAGIVHDEPRNVRALNLLAVTYANLKRYDLADRYHEEALLIDPNSVAALNNWGYSYLLRGDESRAVGLLERAAAVMNGNPVVAANLVLATGQAAGAPAMRPSQKGPAPEAEQSIRLSDHVTLVRRTGVLRRVAPGVQLLVTKASPPGAEAARSDPISKAIEDVPDPRYALFRRMFAMFGGEQAAEASDRSVTSTFATLAEIDDFSAL